MKRKFSLFVNLAMLVLCVSAIAIGVYSAKTASLNVTGSIGFTAHNCELQVSGTKKGYEVVNEEVISYQQTAEPLIKDEGGNATTAIVSTSGTAGSISTLPIGDLKFTDLATEEIPPIVITLTFTNLSAFQVSATVLVDDVDNVRYTRQYVKNDGSDLSSIANHVETVILQPSTAAENKTVTFVITLSVSDPEKDVTDLSRLNITANFAKYDAGFFTSNTVTENNITYTLNSNKTAYSVTGNSLSANTDVTIPAFINYLPVISIGDRVFNSCSYLKSITIPSSVTSIGNHSFFRCTSLSSITIPSSVTSIGDSAFSNCTSLSSITIPDGVTSIAAFSNCTSLSSITIPDSVTSIGEYTFAYCTSLSRISFGANSKLTSIEYSAFYDCTSLSSITIPEGVTRIGYAFPGCSNLTEMTVLATTPPALFNTSSISSATTKIYIPAGTLSAYQSATNWSSYADKFVEMAA